MNQDLSLSREILSKKIFGTKFNSKLAKALLDVISETWTDRTIDILIKYLQRYKDDDKSLLGNRYVKGELLHTF